MKEKIYKSKTLAAFTGSGIAVILATLTVWFASYSTDALFYAESSRPMITAVDGFFYLANAQDYLSNGISVPAISWFIAVLHSLTNIPLTSVAFWMAPFVALALFFCYAAWGRVLALSPLTTFFAALIGGLIPSWLERSRIGWFDTDPAISLFWNICLVSTAILSLPASSFEWTHDSGKTATHKILAGCSLLLSALMLAWWWKPGAALIPFCLFMWGVTYCWSATKIERYTRLGALCLCVVGASIVLLTPSGISSDIAGIRTYAIEHVRLVLGIKGDIISTSIEEIATFPLKYSLKNIGGHWLGGALLLGALACFLARYPRASLFLIPSLVALGMGFFSERFLYLAALPLGLAAASLGHSVALWLRRPPMQSHAINALCTLLILISLGQWLYAWVPHGYFVREHDAVATALRRASTHKAPVWNWWDDGYFLRARAGLSPLFDGGTQDPLRAYIVGRPLLTEDLRFARRWIRFFSLRGIHGLQPLVQHYKDANIAWQMLDSIFAADHTDALIQSLPRQLQEWLFPHGSVYIYFSQRILTISQWWGSLGKTRFPKPEDVRPCVEVFKVSNFHYNPETNLLILPDAVQARGYTALTDIYETVSRPIRPPFPQEQGIFAVTSPFSRWLYLVTREGLTSLPIRLLAPGGIELEGFRPIAVDYDYAGAWEVLP